MAEDKYVTFYREKQLSKHVDVKTQLLLVSATWIRGIKSTPYAMCNSSGTPIPMQDRS